MPCEARGSCVSQPGHGGVNARACGVANSGCQSYTSEWRFSTCGAGVPPVPHRCGDASRPAAHRCDAAIIACQHGAQGLQARTPAPHNGTRRQDACTTTADARTTLQPVSTPTGTVSRAARPAEPVLSPARSDSAPTCCRSDCRARRRGCRRATSRSPSCCGR